LANLRKIEKFTNFKNSYLVENKIFFNNFFPKKRRRTTLYDEQILQTCKNIEKREKHQSELFNKFVENVKYEETEKIMLWALVGKYSLQSVDILEGLYLHGVGMKSINPNPKKDFSVCLVDDIPNSRVVGKESYSDDDDVRNAMIKLEQKYKKSVRNKESFVNSDGLTRTIDENFEYVILKRMGDYNYVMLKKMINAAEKTVELLEIKKDKPFNKTMLKRVLEVASNYDNRIDSVGNVSIGSTFDDEYIYSVMYYDDAYGKGAFIDAILKVLQKNLYL